MMWTKLLLKWTVTPLPPPFVSSGNNNEKKVHSKPGRCHKRFAEEWTIHSSSGLPYWPIFGSHSMDRLDFHSRLACFHLHWMTKPLVLQGYVVHWCPLGLWMMKWRSCCYQRDTTLLLIEKAFKKPAGRRRRCWGLSDTPLIRGSSTEVEVCTMKHADGDTMTHMLHLTVAWFRCGRVKRKEKKK